MPQPVAERVHAPAVVALHDLAVLVEVRYVAERLVAEPALSEDPTACSGVELTIEAPRERQLLLVRERLIVEHEDSVLVHPRADRGERSGVVHGREVDGTRLGHEVRM